MCRVDCSGGSQTIIQAVIRIMARGQTDFRAERPQLFDEHVLPAGDRFASFGPRAGHVSNLELSQGGKQRERRFAFDRTNFVRVNLSLLSMPLIVAGTAASVAKM